MYQLKDFELKASEIAGNLKLQMIGDDLIVNNIQQLDLIDSNSMSVCYPKFKNRLEKISHKCLIFCTLDTVIDNGNISFIICDNPKLSFFKYILDNLVYETSYWYELIVSEAHQKYPDVKFGYNVRIGKNVVIAPNSVIESNCIIGNNVVIRSNVRIGEYTTIKDNTIIGSEGFGFMNSDEGLIHIPQIGGIIIGTNVTIGSNCAVEKPALGFTVIGNHVKIDDLVQIGHNQEIGDNTIITTGFKAEGNVKIGKNTFIGMGVTIISKKVSIGNNCLIGAGTIVTKSIPDNKVARNKIELIMDDINDKLTNILSVKK